MDPGPGNGPGGAECKGFYSSENVVPALAARLPSRKDVDVTSALSRLVDDNARW